MGTGPSDEERRNPPAVGSIITFRYQELSNDGVTRFPSYVAVGTDHAWPASKTKSRGAKKKAQGKAAPSDVSTKKVNDQQGASRGKRYFELVDAHPNSTATSGMTS